MPRTPTTHHNQTLFPAGSLAKAIASAALGILVEDGATAWDMLAKDAVPSYQPEDAVLQSDTTLTDLLNHRSGMSSYGHLVGGCEANVLLRHEDVMRVVNSQVLLPERRGAFYYNSTAYDLFGEAIKHLSGGTSVADVCRTRIFEPLGLPRTFMNPPSSVVTDNVATCYNALDGGTPVRTPSPRIGEEGIGAASGGLWSCSTDLVRLYGAFLRSYKHQVATGQTTTPGSPLKHVAHMMSAQVAMSETEQHTLSYGMGWACVQLPNTLGHIGLNGRLMPQEMSIVGKGVPGQLVFYHQGTLPGTLATVLLLPDSDSIIVVLSTSLALTDVPDWASQMVLQEILDVSAAERIDFLQYAQAAVAINLEWHPCMVQSLADSMPDPKKQPKSLVAYTGTYVDESGVFRNVVRLQDGELSWSFQGLQSEKFALTHYDGDTFT